MPLLPSKPGQPVAGFAALMDMTTPNYGLINRAATALVTASVRFAARSLRLALAT